MSSTRLTVSPHDSHVTLDQDTGIRLVCEVTEEQVIQMKVLLLQRFMQVSCGRSS